MLEHIRKCTDTFVCYFTLNEHKVKNSDNIKKHYLTILVRRKYELLPSIGKCYEQIILDASACIRKQQFTLKNCSRSLFLNRIYIFFCDIIHF